jgi:phage tail sheath protein FI
LSAHAITDTMRQIDAPLLCSFQPFRKADGSYVMPPAQALSLNLNQGRVDCFVIWDGNPLAAAGSSYVTNVTTRAQQLVSSYDALYCPWIVVPDPARPGATIIVPPSGSVQGMMARMDATVGPWRAPAGLPAVLSTAVATEVKFSDTDQGALNYQNINVVRAVQGSGICVMGARTRKLYGPDRYVSARRTLIFIEDSLKLSTQYAVFENNDQRLWTALRNTAQQILQPIWERGGLAGSTAAAAYYITCDATLNNAQVIQSGEVRMEIGVALQYPAEFVVIRVSQFDSGASLTAEFITGQVAA